MTENDEPSWGHIAKKLAVILAGGGVIMCFMLVSASHPSEDDVVRGAGTAFISGVAGWLVGTLKG